MLRVWYQQPLKSKELGPCGNINNITEHHKGRVQSMFHMHLCEAHKANMYFHYLDETFYSMVRGTVRNYNFCIELFGTGLSTRVPSLLK